MPAYHVATGVGELHPTKSYPKPGQRLFYWQAPGVLNADADGEPLALCLMDVDILQWRGSKEDKGGYHVKELLGDDVRNLPRDEYGRPAAAGYLFVCFTSEPTPERPGIYAVACNRTGAAYWCACLGARGHKKTSSCKHRDFVTHLAEQPARKDFPTQPESASVRATT